MSEETTNDDSQPEVPAQEPDWKAEARKWESRAKTNLARADENAAAAARLAELEEASKTAEQKQAEALDAANQRVAELESQALRATVAAEKNVPVELLHGTSREELEAAADSLIKFKGTTPVGPFVPGEGKQIKSRDERREFLNQLVNNS